MAIAAAVALAPEAGGAAYRRIVVEFCLVLLMPPLAWIADRAWSKNSISLKTRDIIRLVSKAAMPTLQGDFFVM